MSMIEGLIGSGIRRPDKKRILTTRRPLPNRPRELFELIVSLGGEATMTSIFQIVDLRQAEPRGLTFLTLNRWPTEAEVAAHTGDYRPAQHLRQMLAGREFRASLIRRIFDLYPERPRIFFVRIPRCAGEHLIATVNPMHPILPADLAAWHANDETRFIPALGRLLGRFTLTRTLMMVQPNIAPFIQAVPPPAPTPDFAGLGMRWTLNPPPRRVGDRLFTIVRDPAELILSEVNATVDRLLQPPGQDTAATSALRTRLAGLPPPANAAARKALAREILRTLALRNPICHALGDGTAADALRTIRLHDLEIADLAHYADWVKYTWDVEPEAPINVATEHLARTELSQEELFHLNSLINEDSIFYATVGPALAGLPELRNSVRGREV